MEERRCLYCYQLLAIGETDFHEKCSVAFFGRSTPPLLDYTSKNMEDLAKQIIVRSVALTGVQPKLSLTIESQPGDPRRSRFTIVGLWGDYILKPPTKEFPNLPENEDVTMHLAALFGIETAKHSLMRLKSGELAYVTKRFDRLDGNKLALEDMCQLTETLTADKYRSSMEKVGRYLRQYSSRPGLDALRLFEVTLFSFLTGNADMHLKNFSLLTASVDELVLTVLSPAYDLLNTKLAMPKDEEEVALTLNAKKRKIKKSDFDAFAQSLKIPERSIQRTYERFATKIDDALVLLKISFLSKKEKIQYINLIKERISRIGLR